MSNQDVGSRTLTALKWGYGGAVARALAQLLIQSLLARMLGPEAFGQATAAILVLTICFIASEAGFGTALIQKTQLSDHDISNAVGWVLLLSGSMAVMVMLLSGFLAKTLGGQALQPLIFLAGALIPIQALGNIPASLMRRNLDGKRSQLIYIGSYLLAYGVVGLSLAWAGAGAWSLMAAAAVQAVTSLVASYVAVQHTLRPRLQGAKALWSFGSVVTVINVTGWFAENADRFLVNRFWGAAALGEYNAAATLSRAPANLMMSSAQTVTLASASRVQDDRDRLGRSYLALLCVVTLLSAPVFSLLAWNAEIVVRLVYGDQWSNSAPLFAAFCISIPFVSILSFSGPVLWAIKAVRQDLFIQLAMLAAVILGFYSLRHHELAYAAWLIPTLYAIRSGSAYLSLQSRLNFGHRRAAKAFFAGMCFTAIVSAVCFAAHLWLKPGPALLVSLPLSVGLSLICLQRWPHRMLAPELVALLRNRSESSPALAKLCALLRITPVKH